MRDIERWTSIACLVMALLSHLWHANPYTAAAFLGALICVVSWRYLSDARAKSIIMMECEIADLNDMAATFEKKIAAIEAKLAEQDAGIAKAIDGIKASVGIRSMMGG